MLIELVERLVIGCVAILQAHIVEQRLIQEIEAALPARIDIEVNKGLFLLVPIIGRGEARHVYLTCLINASYNIHRVPTAIIVVVIDVSLSAQSKGTGTDSPAIVHREDIVVKLLLVAVLIEGDHLAGILSVPAAVVIEPHAQFLMFLVDDAVAEVHPEVSLGADSKVEVAPLVTKVVRRAVTIGQ